MKRHIKKYANEADEIADINAGILRNKYVALIADEHRIDWNTKDDDAYAKMPLTFEIVSGGTINWKAKNVNNKSIKTIEYKLNNGEWTSITSNAGSSAPTINVVAGDIVQFRGNNTAYAEGISYYSTFDGTTAYFNVYGNIMSLIDSVNYSSLTSIATDAFIRLFKGLNVISANNLILRIINDQCYFELFSNCSLLISAPELPSITIGRGSYNSMFAHCTSLTTAPALPATTLVYQSYATMFYGCTNLNYIKCLATDISAQNCTISWLNSVSSTGTFVKKVGVEWPSGSSGIPEGWTVIDA